MLTIKPFPIRFPAVRRLLTVLADAHPMVLAVSSQQRPPAPGASNQDPRRQNY